MSPDTDSLDILRPLVAALVSTRRYAAGATQWPPDASRMALCERIVDLCHTHSHDGDRPPASEAADANAREADTQMLLRLGPEPWIALLDAHAVYERDLALLHARRSAARDAEDRQRALRQAERLGAGALADARYRASRPDFTAWLARPHWSFDEALALLMGADPADVSWYEVKAWLGCCAFADQMAAWRAAAVRAPGMVAGRQLRPADVLAWAQASGVAALPPGLHGEGPSPGV